jgi:hypothetical protein
MLKRPNKTAMAPALSATRFEKLHAQYCKTESRMPVASRFSNGFGKAVAILDYLGGKADAFITDKQEYKYRANAVIDEDTGKSMEYRDLLKDPKHRETGPEQLQMNSVDYLMEQVRIKMVPNVSSVLTPVIGLNDHRYQEARKSPMLEHS